MDKVTALRVYDTNKEAVERFYERMAEVHPDGNYCDEDNPCGPCAPLLQGQDEAWARMDEATAAALPAWLIRLIDFIARVWCTITRHKHHH